MTFKLHGLVLDEVSLVDNPANQGAHIALFKRDGGEANADVNELLALLKKAMTFAELLEAEEARTEAMDTINAAYQAIDLLGASVNSIMYDDAAENKVELVQQSIREFAEMFGKLHTTTETNRGDNTMIVKTGNDALDKMFASIEMPDEIGKAVEAELSGLLSRADKAEQELAALTKKDDDITKGMTDAQLSEFNKMRDDMAKLRDKDLRASIKQSLGDNLAVIGKSSDIIDITHNISKMDAELGDKVVALLADVSKRIATGELFTELGKAGERPGNDIEGVLAERDAIATKLREADPNLSLAAARDLAWTRNPDLRKRYDDARKAGH